MDFEKPGHGWDVFHRKSRGVWVREVERLTLRVADLNRVVAELSFRVSELESEVRKDEN